MFQVKLILVNEWLGTRWSGFVCGSLGQPWYGPAETLSLRLMSTPVEIGTLIPILLSHLEGTGWQLVRIELYPEV